jgi:hypothetical protein
MRQNAIINQLVSPSFYLLYFIVHSNIRTPYTNKPYLLAKRRDLIRNFTNIHFVRFRGCIILSLSVFATKGKNEYLKYDDNP